MIMIRISIPFRRYSNNISLFMKKVPSIDNKPSVPPDAKTNIARLASRDLFGQETRVEIEHSGEIYLLQITRHGKLILTK